MTSTTTPPIDWVRDPESIPWIEENDPPDISHLVIEDDAPVDNLIQEKQQRLLVDCLYSSLQSEAPFLAAANVGLFYGLHLPALVPDVMLSLGVSVAADWHQRRHRSYFVWEFGKPPDVAIEIVSNQKGNELGSKLTHYAQAGVTYYAVFDPLQQLTEESVLQVFALREGSYYCLEQPRMPPINLGFTLWEGEFEGKSFPWLRWQDSEGRLLLTGNERAEQEYQRAEQEYQRAEQERQRADRLASLLHAQGIDPDQG